MTLLNLKTGVVEVSDAVATRTQAMPPDDSRALRLELQPLYEDYAACLDDGEINRWPDFFTDDANYQVIGRDNYDAGLTHATLYCAGKDMIRDRALAISETVVYEPRFLRHIVGGVRIKSTGKDVVSASANFVILESKSDQDPIIFLSGRYVDSLVKTGERWLFAERLCVFDNYRIRTTLVFPA
jgi:anthranilate 1,2-dioxygenase small subunit